MAKPYLFYGPKIFNVMGRRDGQAYMIEKRSLGTEIVWCEPKDLVEAKINLEQDQPTGKMEIWHIWELTGREIKIPAGCESCAMRVSGCLDRCLCREV